MRAPKKRARAQPHLRDGTMPSDGHIWAQVRDKTDRACGMRDSCKSTRASGISSRQRSILDGCRAAILCDMYGIDDLIDHHGRVLCKNRLHLSILTYDTRVATPRNHCRVWKYIAPTYVAKASCGFVLRLTVCIVADIHRATKLHQCMKFAFTLTMKPRAKQRDTSSRAKRASRTSAQDPALIAN